MGKQTLNAWLLIGLIVPVVLLFWPFAYWGGVMSLLLRVVAALSAQLLLCRTGKHWLVRACPLILTGAMALWGTYLFFTSAHWVNATFGDLTADYLSPFITCAAAYCTISFISKHQ